MRTPLLALLVNLLPLAAAAQGELPFRPTRQLGPGSPDAARAQQTPVKVLPCTDQRTGEKGKIGENVKQNRPAITTADIPSWASNGLRTTLGKGGFRVVETGEAVQLRCELLRAFVTESDGYVADVHLRVAALAAGQPVFETLLEGKSQSGGKPLDVQVYVERLADALVSGVQGLVDNPGFLAALAGDAVPSAAAPLPPAPAPVGPATAAPAPAASAYPAVPPPPPGALPPPPSETLRSSATPPPAPTYPGATVESSALSWKPTHGVTLQPIDRTRFLFEKVKVAPFDDLRTNKPIWAHTAMGGRALASNTDLAVFATAYVKSLLREHGVEVVESGETVVLKGEIVRAFVEEAATADGEFNLRVTLEKRKTPVWRGVVAGKGKRRASGTVETWFEALSDAIVDGSEQLLNNPTLFGAFK